MKKRIAIQGIKGSNHHQVAREYFGENIELVECMSFHGLVDQLLEGNADKGVMAIENSIAGSIIPNYALVYQNDLHIIGEHYLNIHHNLMVLKGQTWPISEKYVPIPWPCFNAGNTLKRRRILKWWRMWIRQKRQSVFRNSN